MAVMERLDTELVRRLRWDATDDGRQSLVWKEWLVTNGLGGYASGTVAGVLTRRYHGMLVDRTETNVNVHVVGSKLDEARARLASLPDVLVPGQLLPPRAPDAE